MFEAKTTDKLRSTDTALYNNKLKLEEFRLFNPFELKDLNGIKVLARPNFEPYYKVIKSLKVVDENGQFLKNQTNALRKDIVQAARHAAYLDLLYQKELPPADTYYTLMEEKLLIELVNLVLEKELPIDQQLNASEIELAQKTFKEMLKNAS